jgi:ATP-dependent helicase/nuclease subunit A
MVVAFRRDPLFGLARQIEGCGIPVEVTGGAAVNEVEEVRLLRTALAALARPDDPVALVGALRSALFGVSDDELYRFKQADGWLAIPGAKQAATIDGCDAIADALASLQRGEIWLRRLQPAAALERIAVELGLVARASAGIAANARAGCLARALELVRQVAREGWSIADLADYLDELIFQEHSQERHDGLPARPLVEAVRVMNLHQVKGLEAPIVILAEGRGEWRDGVDVCIDRSAEAATGFLAVRGRRRRFGAPGHLLAIPDRWDRVEDREKRFRRAEHDRLLYVAATRAGCHLVISRPQGRDPRWVKLAEAMNPETLEPITEPVTPPAPPAPEAPAVAGFLEMLADRRAVLVRPTYAVQALKNMVVRGAVRAGAPEGETTLVETPQRLAGEHGTEWGEVVHLVLEAAAHQPLDRLRGIAASALEERGMDRVLVDRVLAVVQRVKGSALWERSRAITG